VFNSAETLLYALSLKAEERGVDRYLILAQIRLNLVQTLLIKAS
jgi:hypothetical protein